MAAPKGNPTPPDLQVIATDEPRRPLIGIGGAELVCRPDPAGTIDAYFADITDITSLPPDEQRTWPRGRHVVHILSSADGGAWGVAHNIVAIGLATLVDVLDGTGIRQLVLGRDAGIVLSVPDPGSAMAEDRHVASEALLARSLCGRDADCELRHAFFIATGSSIWVWHYNFDTGAVVPPKPVLGLT